MLDSLETRLIERREKSKPLRLDNVLLLISLAGINKANGKVAQEIETWICVCENLQLVLVNYIKIAKLGELLL